MSHFTPTGWGQSGKWNGLRLPGQRWTEPQKQQMMFLRGTLEGWEVHKVRLKRPGDAPHYVPVEVEVECPILKRFPDQIVIIAPGGDRVPIRKVTKIERRS